MRITEIRATPVRVPVTRPGVMAGKVRTHVSRTIVEVLTDDGAVGLGETRGEYCAPIVRRFAEALTGLDPLDRNAARRSCVAPPFDHGLAEQRIDLLAYAGIELALWDIAGKRHGVPVYRLLGGAARPAAQFGAYAYAPDLTGRTEADAPAMMADVAAELMATTGADTLEFKVGVHSLASDIATIRRIRQTVGPAVRLAIDANMGHSLAEADRLLAETADCRIDNFEEPTPRIAEYPRLQVRHGVATSTHCTDFDALAGAEAIGGGRIDGVVSDLHYHGGIDAIRELMAAVVRRGHRFWLRSSWELGISWAAMCHVALSSPLLTLPSQTLINWVGDDLIEGEPWLLRNGGICPPDRPGLGVELDRAALARFAV